jgi:hypothetical protein
MASIEVKVVDATTFEVTVAARSTTRHTVTVSPAYAERLAQGRAAAAELVEKSFEFLLEREPNTSILRSFDLPVIGRYFPEYEEAMRKAFE